MKAYFHFACECVNILNFMWRLNSLVREWWAYKLMLKEIEHSEILVLRDFQGDIVM